MLTHQPEPSVVADNLQHGFVQLPRLVLRAKGLSLKAKLTYSLLLDYAWDKDTCFPSHETLATELDTSVDTVQRALHELRDFQLIDWQQQGANKPNRYTLLSLSENPNITVPEAGYRNLRLPATASCGPNDIHLTDTEITGGDTSKIRTAETEETRYVNPTAPLPNNNVHPPATQHEAADQAGDCRHPNEGREPDTKRVQTYRNIEVPNTQEIPRPVPTDGAGVRNISQPRPVSVPHPESAPAVPDGTYEAITAFVRDIAAELNDQAPLRSSVTRAWRLYRASGVSIDTFFNHIYDARKETQRRSGSITKHDTAGFKAKMAYFFAVLEDLLGFRKRNGFSYA